MRKKTVIIQIVLISGASKFHQQFRFSQRQNFLYYLHYIQMQNRSEETREDAEGNSVSYNPPRFCYSYDFKIIIRVNHPYFDTMSFQLNPSGVEINPENATSNPPNPRLNQDYKEYEAMGKEIKEILTRARQQVREEKESAAKPKTAVQCPCCGATTIPDANGHCEYCGGAVQG